MPRPPSSTQIPPGDRFHCHCGKSFIRKEHLKRHEATHARPAHVCDVCGRSFSRSDLLRRHAALHEGPQVVEPRRARACDACHESKVRCDGDVVCSLCQKRGVACTYLRSKGPGDDVQLGGMAEVNQQEVTGLASTENLNSTIEHPQDIDMGLDTVTSDETTTRMSPSTTRDNTLTGPAAARGFSTLLTVLKSSAPLERHQQTSPCLTVVEDWWNACYDIYLSDFNLHWSLIHSPSWHEQEHSIRWEACVALIATWYRAEEQEFREKAVQLHEVMVGNAMKELIMGDEVTEGGWPHETWVVAMINVIFAVDTGRSNLIAKARRLFSLVVDDCRTKQAFSTQNICDHQTNHRPGHFRPWVFAQREHINRLAVAIFRLDTSLSLLYHTAPLLRRDELDIRLPVPHTLWNAFGLHNYFSRLTREPKNRKVYKVAQLLRCATPHLSPCVLFEDVQLMLYDVAQGAWQLWRARRMDGNVEASTNGPMQMKLLRCEELLKGLDNAMQAPEAFPEVYEYLLWAYMDKETGEEEGWQGSVVARIREVQLTTQLLWHSVNIHIYADTQRLQETFIGTPKEGTDPSRQLMNESVVKSWTRSPDGRTSLLHALSAIKAYEDYDKLISPTLLNNHLANIAIFDAGLVILAHRLLNDTEQMMIPRPIIAPTFDLQSFGLRVDDGGELGLWLRSGSWASVGGEMVPGPIWPWRWCLGVKEGLERWPILKPVYAAMEASFRG